MEKTLTQEEIGRDQGKLTTGRRHKRKQIKRTVDIVEQHTCRAYGKTCSKCGKVNHHKALCRSTQKQRQSQRSPQRNKATYDVQQKEPHTRKQRDSCKNIDSVNMKYLNFYNVRSVIFTKVELSTRKKKRTWIMYKIETGSNGNLMPFKVLKILFPRSVIAELHATKIIQLC